MQHVRNCDRRPGRDWQGDNQPNDPDLGGRDPEAFFLHRHFRAQVLGQGWGRVRAATSFRVIGAMISTAGKATAQEIVQAVIH